MNSPKALTCSYVLILCYFGCFGRVCLEELQGFVLDFDISLISSFSSPNGPEAFKDCFANLLGCLLLGLLATQTLLNSSTSLFIGIASGFCGSLTTFSGWMQFISVSLTKGNIVQGFSTLFQHFFSCICCYKFGIHIGTVINFLHSKHQATIKSISPPISPPTPESSRSSILSMDIEVISVSQVSSLTTLPPTSTNDITVKDQNHSKIIIILSLVCGIIITTMASTIAYFYSTIRWEALAVALAPFGAIPRWYLSTLTFKPSLFFTFIVNFLGTTIIALLNLGFFRNKTIEMDLDWVQYSISIGFCGCLTTMSTFIKEISALTTSKSYIYALVSLIATQLIILPINLFTY